MASRRNNLTNRIARRRHSLADKRRLILESRAAARAKAAARAITLLAARQPLSPATS